MQDIDQAASGDRRPVNQNYLEGAREGKAPAVSTHQGQPAATSRITPARAKGPRGSHRAATAIFFETTQNPPRGISGGIRTPETPWAELTQSESGSPGLQAKAKTRKKQGIHRRRRDAWGHASNSNNTSGAPCLRDA